MQKKWLIYGAYGYTGELIAREAKKRGMSPVLAGRSEEKLKPLGEELQLETRVFLVDSAAGNLSGITLVLHCAGPFQKTSAPMIEACLEAGAHYLDITGEISVFQHSFAQDAKAKEAGILICSGVGFDVIPTDCTALKLKEEMPDATSLSLGFDSDSGISPGTYKTMIQGTGSGSAERRDGKIIPVAIGSQRRTIDFGRGTRSAMGIPWGDVSTAFHTTGIPNIQTWIPMKKANVIGARIFSPAGALIGLPPIQKRLMKWVEKRVSGPDETLRAGAPAYIWGEARNPDGVIKTVRIQTANVYDLTVYGALEVVSRLLEGDSPSGSHTPAALFGSGLLEDLPGSGKFEVETIYPA
ncbi:saccharopine dehydrogenase family protein [Planococcus beigongshangi]|uniref:saccharopine dehydrogenase family protein n=1 Tax=Planococcus beigongshangi TaxID=2782536 RepID=UPI001EED2621|nr:saccharopine dehydrogenase NADP-binding domain-containing protein [Planococcus beigongshangi]